MKLYTKPTHSGRSAGQVYESRHQKLLLQKSLLHGGPGAAVGVGVGVVGANAAVGAAVGVGVR
eukprot:4294149-Prymnesium_polylepis.1